VREVAACHVGNWRLQLQRVSNCANFARMAADMRNRLKSTMGRVARLTGAYERRFRSQMTIVAFHRVNDELPGDALTCAPAKFEAFCRFFGKHFRVVPLAEQVAGCRAGCDLGGTLSITLDDGYLDHVEIAAPILRRLNLPATFFVTTGFIGSQVTPAWDRDLPIRSRWMTWDDVYSLHSQGFEIGSHTDSHLDIAKADPETVRADLALSRKKLLEALGTSAVPLFAYPFGGPQHISRQARELVREAGFACCVACHGGVNAPSPDPFALNRIAVDQWYTDPDLFGFELLTGRRAYGAGIEPRNSAGFPGDVLSQ